MIRSPCCSCRRCIASPVAALNPVCLLMLIEVRAEMRMFWKMMIILGTTLNSSATTSDLIHSTRYRDLPVEGSDKRLRNEHLGRSR